jgi:hypothetical protein
MSQCLAIEIQPRLGEIVSMLLSNARSAQAEQPYEVMALSLAYWRRGW